MMDVRTSHYVGCVAVRLASASGKEVRESNGGAVEVYGAVRPFGFVACSRQLAGGGVIPPAASSAVLLLLIRTFDAGHRCALSLRRCSSSHRARSRLRDSPPPGGRITEIGGKTRTSGCVRSLGPSTRAFHNAARNVESRAPESIPHAGLFAF